MRSILTIGVLTTLLFTGCYITPKNKGVVNDEFIRTRLMSPSNLRSVVEEYNIRSVVNLRGMGEERINAQKKALENTQSKYYHIPFNAKQYPSKETLSQLIETIQNSEYPLLVHCNHGADRTGLANSIYNMIHLHEDPKKARKGFSLSHGHVSIENLARLPNIVRAYERYSQEMNFSQWVSSIYSQDYMTQWENDASQN